MKLEVLKQRVLIDQVSILKDVEVDEGIWMKEEIELLEEEMQACTSVQDVHTLLTERGYSERDAYEIIIQYTIEK